MRMRMIVVFWNFPLFLPTFILFSLSFFVCLSFLVDSHFKCLVILGSPFIFKSEPLKEANRNFVQGVGLLNDRLYCRVIGWKQYLLEDTLDVSVCRSLLSSLWVSPGRSLLISSLGMYKLGQGSGNSWLLGPVGLTSQYLEFQLITLETLSDTAISKSGDPFRFENWRYFQKCRV